MISVETRGAVSSTRKEMVISIDNVDSLAISGATAMTHTGETTMANAKATRHSMAISGTTAMATATEFAMATVKATRLSMAISSHNHGQSH